MLGFSKAKIDTGFLSSRLLDQDSFYRMFLGDLKQTKYEVIIESPFLSPRRIGTLLQAIDHLVKRGVKVIVNTKPPEEQSEYDYQAQSCIIALQEVGVIVLFTGGHHRKLAIIDRKVLYEGSLNILSQNDSCEIMRRLDSETLAKQMLAFTGINKLI